MISYCIILVLVVHKGKSKGKIIDKDIPENYRQTFINSIINDNKDTSYTEHDVIETMFRDRNITTHEDAFAHLNDITATMQTAFLFNKRLK